MSALAYPSQTTGAPYTGLDDSCSDPLSAFAGRNGLLLAGLAGPGVVWVDRGRVRAHGLCSCGWMGRQRLLPSFAVLDTLLHAAQNRCRPAVPLVLSA